MALTYSSFVAKRNYLLSFLYILTLSLILSSAYAEEPDPAIVVNQAGYLPDWPKRATLIKRPQTSVVTLRDAETDSLIMMIKPQAFGLSDLNSEDPETQVLDFSQIDRLGNYYLEDGELRSATFQIGKAVYKEPTRLLLRSYYLQRCGVELLDPETGLAHESCHLNV